MRRSCSSCCSGIHSRHFRTMAIFGCGGGRLARGLGSSGVIIAATLLAVGTSAVDPSELFGTESSGPLEGGPSMSLLASSWGVSVVRSLGSDGLCLHGGVSTEGFICQEDSFHQLPCHQSSLSCQVHSSAASWWLLPQSLSHSWTLCDLELLLTWSGPALGLPEWDRAAAVAQYPVPSLLALRLASISAAVLLRVRERGALGDRFRSLPWLVLQRQCQPCEAAGGSG